MNMKQPAMEEWVNEKLSQLTLEEKAHFLSGVDVWRTLAVPRLGIPQLKVRHNPCVLIPSAIFPEKSLSRRI